MIDHLNWGDEAAKVMIAGGYFESGAIGVIDGRRQIGIVDRKNYFPISSDFNVCSNYVKPLIPSTTASYSVLLLKFPTRYLARHLSCMSPNLWRRSLKECLVFHYGDNYIAYKRPKCIDFQIIYQK